jgi:nucleotide-binding universal stress UspA family protein
MLKTILVPLDGSMLAEQALQPACSAAREADATLVLVRALPFYALTREDQIAEIDSLQEVQRYLRGIQQRLAAEGLTAVSAILPCDPVAAILFAAYERQADLICMSTHGATGLRHALGGSVAETVLRLVPTPLLLVHAGMEHLPRAGAPFRKILVPLDGTPLAEAALTFLADEPIGHAADRILLRTVARELMTAPPLATGSAVDMCFAEADRETEEHRAEAAGYLDAAGRKYLGAASWRAQVACGDPADVIPRVAAAEGVDLIVMATHGRHGMDRLLHGSVAGTLVQETPAPLLLIHAPKTVKHRYERES